MNTEKKDPMVLMLEAKLRVLKQDANNLQTRIAQLEQALSQARGDLIATEGAINITKQYVEEITGKSVDLQKQTSDGGDVKKPPPAPKK